jgi:hypothetical protein
MVASIAAIFFHFSETQVPNQSPQLANRPTIQEQVNTVIKTQKSTGSADFLLVQAHGTVQVLSSEEIVWRNVSDQMVLRFGDKIRTLANSKVHLSYADETKLKLSSNTLVQVQSNGIRVFQGDSWVRVMKKGRIFEAWTPNLVASVRGTIYDISVRSHQRSYEDFLKEITRKNLLKGLSPEAYFQEFSLQTLHEAGSFEATLNVDSKVRVFESSVAVSPLRDGIPYTNREVILEQGQSVRVNSAGKEIMISRVEPLSENDFKYWDMEAPSWVSSDSTPMPASVPVPPGSSPRLKKPVPQAPSDAESKPTFENLQEER